MVGRAVQGGPRPYRTLIRPGVLGFIALGGAAGTVSRAAVADALVTPRGAFPWATWIVNVAGALLVGVIVTLSLERYLATRWVRPLLATGFCGGLTTFSTFSADVVTLTSERSTKLGHGRLALHVTGSLAMTLAGLASWHLIKPA